MLQGEYMKGNDFMVWVLRSPFHGMLSNGMMLITITGRKTGKTYAYWTWLRWLLPACLTIAVVGFIVCALLGVLPFVLFQ